MSDPEIIEKKFPMTLRGFRNTELDCWSYLHIYFTWDGFLEPQCSVGGVKSRVRAR